MEKYLKKAVLSNSKVWTTTIIWRSLPDGATQIVIKQNYHIDRHKSWTRAEIYTRQEFGKAYDRFHQELKNWI